MSTEANRKLFQRLADGEIELIDLWADDGVWYIPGTTRWSGEYRGKEAITRDLFAKLGAEMKTMGTIEYQNIIVDGDNVAVQAQAHGRTTKEGKPYNNTYCLVFKLLDGKVVHMTEYCDTELITEAFGKDPN